MRIAAALLNYNMTSYVTRLSVLDTHFLLNDIQLKHEKRVKIGISTADICSFLHIQRSSFTFFTALPRKIFQVTLHVG